MHNISQIQTYLSVRHAFRKTMNKYLKLPVTYIVSGNFFVNKICNESFLIFEMLKFNACAELRVGISTEDGCMLYLSLILYLREELVYDRMRNDNILNDS